MADMSTLEVEADVSESNLEKVRVDQPCMIELDALPSMRFEGYVSRMVPTVDRTKATIMTKIRFRELDPRILPDMSAKVAFLSRPLGPEEHAPRPAVDAQAVVTRDGRPVVFVVQDGKTVRTPVRSGQRLGELVELEEGPKPGEKVVLRPSERLGDGVAVKPARR
jgi:multidrug efflux pump subunit AcrA (membrane-fusion protein)